MLDVKSYRVMFKVIAQCKSVLSHDIYRAMLKRIARYFENDNESYRAIACNLFSNFNEVSRDKILHCSMLIKYRVMIFLHRLLYFVLSLLLFITNFETNGLP